MKSQASSVAGFGSLPDDALLRQCDLLTLIPFSHATLWRRVGDGTFPKPTKLSERVVAWRVGAVRQWLAQQQSVEV
jgi:predicted DNA-binding transcriptional regulator AlpA